MNSKHYKIKIKNKKKQMKKFSFQIVGNEDSPLNVGNIISKLRLLK